VTGMFELEVARYDWPSMTCGCGWSAGHLPGQLRDLTRAHTMKDASPLLEELDSYHVTHPAGGLQEPSIPVMSCCLAALTGPLPVPARLKLTELVLLILSTALTADSMNPAVTGDHEQCAAVARQALWLLYQQATQSTHPGVVAVSFDVLAVIEPSLHRWEQTKATALAAGHLPSGYTETWEANH
jgi:hypothetical protein